MSQMTDKQQYLELIRTPITHAPIIAVYDHLNRLVPQLPLGIYYFEIQSASLPLIRRFDDWSDDMAMDRITHEFGHRLLILDKHEYGLAVEISSELYNAALTPAPKGDCLEVTYYQEITNAEVGDQHGKIVQV